MYLQYKWVISVKKGNLILVVLLLSIITIFLGVSAAIFVYLGKGTTNNVIQTGRIVFSYSDADIGSEDGNGIDIVNALPISDANGKILSSPKEYFDFTITASTADADLVYEIVANKQDESNMNEGVVKVYLTEYNGNTEVETPITGGSVTPTYSELSDTTNSLLEGKTIYYGTVKAGEVAYGKKFRLRMWLDNRASQEEIGETVFKVKVNVAALSNN